MSAVEQLQRRITDRTHQLANLQSQKALAEYMKAADFKVGYYNKRLIVIQREINDLYDEQVEDLKQLAIETKREAAKNARVRAELKKMIKENQGMRTQRNAIVALLTALLIFTVLFATIDSPLASAQDVPAEATPTVEIVTEIGEDLGNIGPVLSVPTLEVVDQQQPPDLDDVELDASWLGSVVIALVLSVVLLAGIAIFGAGWFVKQLTALATNPQQMGAFERAIDGANATIQEQARQITRLTTNLEGMLMTIAPGSPLTEIVDKVEDVMREATDQVPYEDKLRQGGDDPGNGTSTDESQG